MNSAFKNTLLAAAFGAFSLLVPSVVEASNGSASVSGTGAWSNTSLSLPANCTATIQTTGLSAGADSVVAVFDNATGAIVGWNDDANPGNPASQVPAIVNGSTPRTLRIITYAFSAFSGGTATINKNLAGPGCTTTSVSESITFQRGFEIDIGDTPVNTHLIAVEKQLGIADPMMMYISGYGAPSAFDDDSGNGMMPFMHVNQACVKSPSNPCRVLVGVYATPPGNNGFQLYWDDGMHLADSDSDGLSDRFENWLRGPGVWPDPLLADSDNDGLKDGEELIGRDDPLLKFPYYGADPAVRDLFVEIDWQECKNGNVPCLAGIDIHQYDAARIASIVAQLGDQGIVVHADNGVSPPAGTANVNYGVWGGAARYVSAGYCDQLTPVRAPYFHSLQVGGGGFAQSQGAPGRCMVGGVDAVQATHEFGHQLGLSHGGWRNKSNAVTSGARPLNNQINCKPNYPSAINYPYQNGYGTQPARFSKGISGDLALDPRSAREDLGLGGESAIRNQRLAQFGRPATGPTGAVDWNFDGQIGGASATSEAPPEPITISQSGYAARLSSSVFLNCNSNSMGLT